MDKNTLLRRESKYTLMKQLWKTWLHKFFDDCNTFEGGSFMNPKCPMNELLHALTDHPSENNRDTGSECCECCVIMFMRYLVNMNENPKALIDDIREVLNTKS